MNQDSLEKILKTTVEKVLPKHQKLIVVDSNALIPAALQILLKNNIYAAPVYDKSKSGYIGFIDLVDIISSIMEIFHETELTGEDFDIYTIDARFSALHADKVHDLSKRNPLVGVSRTAPISEGLRKFQETSTHRILVTQSATYMKVENILTQSATVHFLERNIADLGAITKLTLRDLKIGVKNVFSITQDDQALKAFQMMAEHKVSAVPVVDATGKLVTVISAKDIRGLQAKVIFTNLYKPAKDFAASSRIQSLSNMPEIHCTLDTILLDVIVKLAALKIHRLFVVDEAMKPIGVITLGDVLGAVASGLSI